MYFCIQKDPQSADILGYHGCSGSTAYTQMKPGDKPEIEQKRKKKHVQGIQLKRRPELAVKQSARGAGHAAAGTLNTHETARRTEVVA